MSPKIIDVSESFWNIRGSFKVGGLVDVGTQSSLVRLGKGGFVLLDAYTLSDEQEREIRGLTSGGADIEAIINLHPFHTLHVRPAHEQFPGAKLYGTARHVSRFAELPWEPELSESPELHALFADDFDFSVPRGVDFISSNENIHFSSVLAFHRASKTIHVDDTFMYVRLPKAARLLGASDRMSLHPTLAQALERRAGAAAEFRAWALELSEQWGDAENLCAAHTAALTKARNRGASIQERMREALAKARRTLDSHEKKYG